jgi:hypothetical protein
MQMPFAAQVITAVVVPLVAVWMTARMTSRETARAVRVEVTAHRLTALADVLARTSRDLRDVLFARDACASCGTGISPPRLIELADHVDRAVDLALLHVRDEALRRRLHRVVTAAGEVRRHRKNLTEPCDDLLAAAHHLVAVCDQLAEQCLNVVHDGRPTVPPRIPMSRSDRVLNWVLNLLERPMRSLL